MNKKTARVVAFVIIVAMVLTSFSFVFFLPGLLGAEGYVVYGAVTTDKDQKKVDEELKVLEEYMKYIRTNYKDEVDYQTLLDGAFAGVAQALGDPYSEYYINDGDGDAFTQTVNGDFEGIGVTIENADGACRVVAPTKGGPAEKAGIKTGDIVTKVDGKDVTGLTLDSISQLLRGKAGTQVTITVKRDIKEVSYTVTRARIKQECVSYELMDNKIGYISMSGFDDDADLEFKKAHIALANNGAEGYILDLRNNPGGLVAAVILIADQILDSGDIVHFKQQGKYVQSFSASKLGGMSEPIVVLINEGSASASEILAGALKDNKAATLVGTTTYGKGVAQAVSSLSDGSLFKLSTSYFTTPNKTDINGVGITPDYVVRNTTGTDTVALMEKYRGFAPMSENAKPKLGDVGLNVYAAQQRLAFLGYKVYITGTMDQTTVNAVKGFQRESGISDYGVLDHTTMNKLETAAYGYAAGISKEDLQLAKAKEIINRQIKKAA